MLPYAFPGWRLSVAVLVALGMKQSLPASAQAAPERFWLAGRYDGNRIIVYFDAVQFGTHHPHSTATLAPPVAQGFFDPVMLSTDFVAAAVRRTPGAEHFHVGDRYELLVGHSQITTVTLTTLVGYEGDEGVGNDSYIGALGTVDHYDSILATMNYCVVRRHVGVPVSTPKARSNPLARSAGLGNEPVRFDIQAQMATQLNERWKALAGNDTRHRTETTSPAFTIQPFTLADGSLRYYVRAQWGSEAEHHDHIPCALGAWVTPTPRLHILAVEHQTSSYGFDDALPILRNVVDLGHGQTGLIVTFVGQDSMSLALLQYRDGATLGQTRTLQAISAAE